MNDFIYFRLLWKLNAHTNTTNYFKPRPNTDQHPRKPTHEIFLPNQHICKKKNFHKWKSQTPHCHSSPYTVRSISFSIWFRQDVYTDFLESNFNSDVNTWSDKMPLRWTQVRPNYLLIFFRRHLDFCWYWNFKWEFN